MKNSFPKSFFPSKITQSSLLISHTQWSTSAIDFFFFWPCWVIAASGGYFLAAVREPLIVMASLVEESVVVAHRLSCLMACRILPDQESNLCLLHWQTDSLPLSHQGSPVDSYNDEKEEINITYLKEIRVA